jgi:hypothetical protein
MLIDITDPQGRRQIELKDEIVPFGRLKTSTVQLRDSSCSRAHFEIRKKADGYWLNDLGSRNKTWLNGKALVASTKLNAGDVIKAGRCQIVFGPTDATRKALAPATATPVAVPKPVSPASSPRGPVAVPAVPRPATVPPGPGPVAVKPPAPAAAKPPVPIPVPKPAGPAAPAAKTVTDDEVTRMAPAAKPGGGVRDDDDMTTRLGLTADDGPRPVSVPRIPVPSAAAPPVQKTAAPKPGAGDGPRPVSVSRIPVPPAAAPPAQKTAASKPGAGDGPRPVSASWIPLPPPAVAAAASGGSPKRVPEPLKDLDATPAASIPLPSGRAADPGETPASQVSIPAYDIDTPPALKALPKEDDAKKG